MASKKVVVFRCPDCGGCVEMFPGCKIQKIFCSYKWADHAPGVQMVRVKGFCCEYRPDLDGKRCDGCGMCDTGTDEDFDTYAVQVQNGDGYYDGAGTFHYYNAED